VAGSTPCPGTPGRALAITQMFIGNRLYRQQKLKQCRQARTFPPPLPGRKGNVSSSTGCAADRLSAILRSTRGYSPRPLRGRDVASSISLGPNGPSAQSGSMSSTSLRPNGAADCSHGWSGAATKSPRNPWYESSPLPRPGRAGGTFRSEVTSPSEGVGTEKGRAGQGLGRQTYRRRNPLPNLLPEYQEREQCGQQRTATADQATTDAIGED
jgi:hypothetical protein